jgi:hypothetical protein
MHRSLYAVLAIASYRDPEKMNGIIKNRIDELKSFFEKIKKLDECKHKQENAGKMYIMAGVIMHAETELKWLKQLYEDALKGELAEQGDPLTKLYERD